MTIDGVARNAYQELEQVLLERHAKYGSSNVAAAPGGPLNGLRVRMHDKLARLSNYVDNGGKADFADDKLRDCFIDLANYAVIGLLVLDGNWPSLEVKAEKPFRPRVFEERSRWSSNAWTYMQRPDGRYDCSCGCGIVRSATEIENSPEITEVTDAN